MNIERQIEGQRIASNVAAQGEATRILSERPIALSWWAISPLRIVGLGAGCIGLVSDPRSTSLLSVAGLMGILLGSMACVECLRLNKRLNAAVALLNAQK